MSYKPKFFGGKITFRGKKVNNHSGGIGTPGLFWQISTLNNRSIHR